MSDQPDSMREENGTATEHAAIEATDPTFAAPAPAPEGGETTVWQGRSHWQHYLGRIVAGVAAAVLVGWLVGVVSAHFAWSGRVQLWVSILLIVPILALTLGVALLRVLQCKYRLTEQRLFITRGIVSQTIDQTELIRVDDVRVHKALFDRVFGTGTVEVRSTDATDSALFIRGIKDSDRVAELIRGGMRSLRSRSLFVENL